MSDRDSAVVQDFFRKLGTLLGAGVPFADALASFATAPLASPYDELPGRLAIGLLQGRGFAEQLRDYPGLFHPMVVDMVAVAERQGRLDEALPRIAENLGTGGFEPTDVGAAEATVELVAPAEQRRLLDIIAEGLRCRASDIHLEATGEGGRLRMRIDGKLTARQTLAANELRELVAAAKTLFRCDPAEHRLPQDGTATIECEGEPLRIRFSTAAYALGESCTLRLVTTRGVGELPALTEIFNRPATLDAVRAAAARSYGLLVVSGPTGSGKTTTLYSLTATRSGDREKVIAIEDPVELHLPGVQQMTVDYSIGLTFPKALRTALRNDPDVILVGEIRSAETAEIIVQSALVGHQVFTCLHANDAVGALLRPLHVGIEPFLLTDVNPTIVAQRLVRALCTRCRRPVTLDQVGPTSRFTAEEIGDGLHAPQGCDACCNGYRGRLAVHEVLTVTPSVSRALMDNPSYGTVLAAARSDGFETFRTDVIELLRRGRTSLEEAAGLLAGTGEASPRR